MGSQMTRKTQRFSVSTGTTPATTTAVRLEDFVGGMIGADATVGSSQTVTFYVSPTIDGTYSKLVDQFGADVSMTIPAGDPTFAVLPIELFAAPYVKFVSGTATACTLLVKS